MQNLSQFLGGSGGSRLGEVVNMPYSGPLLQMPDGTEWLADTVDALAVPYQEKYQSLGDLGMLTRASRLPGFEPSMNFPSFLSVASDGANRFVMLLTAAGLMKVTPDAGVTWVDSNIPFTITAAGVVRFINGLFYVFQTGVARTDYFTSPDGITWTLRTVNGASTRILVDYAHNSTTLVLASRASATVGQFNGRLIDFSNGSTEQAVNPPPSNLVTFGRGSLIWAPSANLFLSQSTTQGTIYTSANGTAWTQNVGFFPAGEPACLFAASTSLVIAVPRDNTGSYRTSTDAMTWVTRNFDLANALPDLAFDAAPQAAFFSFGHFYVIFENRGNGTRRVQFALRSTNGLDWQVDKTFADVSAFNYSSGSFISIVTDLTGRTEIFYLHPATTSDPKFLKLDLLSRGSPNTINFRPELSGLVEYVRIK